MRVSMPLWPPVALSTRSPAIFWANGTVKSSELVTSSTPERSASHSAARSLADFSAG